MSGKQNLFAYFIEQIILTVHCHISDLIFLQMMVSILSLKSTVVQGLTNFFQATHRVGQSAKNSSN